MLPTNLNILRDFAAGVLGSSRSTTTTTTVTVTVTVTATVTVTVTVWGVDNSENSRNGLTVSKLGLGKVCSQNWGGLAERFGVGG